MLPPGRRYLVLRLVSLLLGGAGVVHGGAPFLDFFLYHRGGRRETWLGIHFEKQGGGGQHAEQCAISAQRPSLVAPPARREAVRAVLSVVDAALVFAAPQAPHVAARLLPASRAPPTVLA